MSVSSNIRLALPGKGALEAATLAFLTECGMKVSRSNPRQYLARMNSMPQLEIVFQRAADIPALVHDGDAALGITGYDILAEYRGEDSEDADDDSGGEQLMLLERDLGFGACRLVVAVPETWIDVNTCADLWHLAGYYQTHKHRGLRIATKYPLLTGQFLRRHGITRCKIISPHGALEAAPLTDTADLIVDLTETGTTLRENRLKLIEDGVVLRSQACLIANGELLRQHEQAYRLAATMLELISARMQARNRSLLTASLQVDANQSLVALSQTLQLRLKSLGRDVDLRIVRGETASGEQQHYTISGIVSTGGVASDLLEIVAALRSLGAQAIDVTPLTYRFAEESVSVQALRERIKRRT